MVKIIQLGFFNKKILLCFTLIFLLCLSIGSICAEELNDNSFEVYSEKTLDDLISYIDEKLSDSQSSQGLNLIFDSLCEPKEESLTLGNLPQIARESEDIISEKELRYLIQRAQMGGEEINFDEFFFIFICSFLSSF